MLALSKLVTKGIGCDRSLKPEVKVLVDNYLSLRSNYTAGIGSGIIKIMFNQVGGGEGTLR